jgi:hypothetical protein
VRQLDATAGCMGRDDVRGIAEGACEGILVSLRADREHLGVPPACEVVRAPSSSSGTSKVNRWFCGDGSADGV